MAFSIKVGFTETRRFWSKKQMINVIASEAGIMEAGRRYYQKIMLTASS